MGLFDILSPLFDIVDGAMASVLPAVARLAVWAAVLAIGTLLLYKVLSPQKRIGIAKREAREARRRLNSFDGEFADAGPLIKDQFVTAFRHIGLVVPGTFLAILPLLCFLAWADNHFDYRLPPAGQTVAVTAQPATSQAHTAWNAASQPPSVSVAGSGASQQYPMRVPVAVIAKKTWWNWLIANPLGYLPDASPLDAVNINLPAREFLSFGPSWIRGWLGVFIPVMFIISLLMFKWARIE